MHVFWVNVLGTLLICHWELDSGIGNGKVHIMELYSEVITRLKVKKGYHLKHVYRKNIETNSLEYEPIYINIHKKF